MPDDVISQQPITYTQIATSADQQYQEALRLVTGGVSVLAKAE
jgi:carboxyl-terminal processing protease